MVDSLSAHGSTSVPSRVLSVLIIEDVPSTRLFLRSVLERCGSVGVVEEAKDASSALLLAGQSNPAVILLDLGLPGTSGAELLPQLRKASPGSDIVVLSSSARVDGPDLLAEGARGYIEKGLPPFELLEALSHVLQIELSFGNAVPIAEVPSSSPDPKVTPSTFRTDNAHAGGIQACSAVVAEDDWMTCRQLNQVLVRAGAEVVLNTNAGTRPWSSVVLAALAAAPSVVLLGDLLDCERDSLVADIQAAHPDIAVVLYCRDSPSSLSGSVRWVMKPDLETLEHELRSLLVAP